MEQENKRIYTIEDIAAALGVSKATVSRALSGKGRMSEQTRGRIRAYAQQCSYRPNAMAQSLAQSRTMNIGLVIPHEEETAGIPFFWSCMTGIRLEAAENRYDVLIAMAEDGGAGQAEALIDHHKVDGLIVSRSLVRSPIIGLLQKKRVPFVVVGPTEEAGIIHVDNDNRGACCELVRLLIGRGARRLALLGGNENYCVTASRYQGFLDACHLGGLNWDAQRVFMNVHDPVRMARCMEHVTDGSVECLVCMDDSICGFAMLALRERGVRIPQDIMVASLYDSPLMERCIPPVTSLRFDAVKLGRRACAELIAQLEGRPAHSCILPEYQMLLRESTRQQIPVSDGNAMTSA